MPGTIAGKADANGIEQILMAEWLHEELDCAALHALGGRGPRTRSDHNERLECGNLACAPRSEARRATKA
jgi:hypothetical protein